MNLRENAMAILHYEKFDQYPVVSFGYWPETLGKWAAEGHITHEEAEGYGYYLDNYEADRSIMKKLGFDFNWSCYFEFCSRLHPNFGHTVLEERPDGILLVRDPDGLIILQKPGITSIPAVIGTSMTGREAWEELYLPKLRWSLERINTKQLKAMTDNHDIPLALHCGSLMGYMRNFLGLEQFSYLYVDDKELYIEIIDTLADLCYQGVKTTLETGAKFDYAHFWEDICFKNGPIVSPQVFEAYVAPHYKKITDLLAQYNIDIVSVDCDGCIDSLVPIWLKNGVNTMFPIEVGTWNGNIGPWREKYGKALRGVGGMNKKVFACDREAVDKEVERLKRLIDLGGYIACPDHRIAPDAKFELVQYYCEKMHELKI